MIAMECFRILSESLPVMRQFPYDYADTQDAQLYAIEDDGKHMRMRASPNLDEISILIMGDGPSSWYSVTIALECAEWKLPFGQLMGRRIIPKMRDLIKYYLHHEAPTKTVEAAK